MGTGTGRENAKWVSIKTNGLTLGISEKLAFFKHLWDGSEANS
jgi:hypothetical protein